MSEGKTKLERMEEMMRLVAAGSSVVDAAKVVGVTSADAYTYRSKLKHGGLNRRNQYKPSKNKPAKSPHYETLKLETPPKASIKGMDFVFVVPTNSIKSFMESMQ